MGTHSDAGADHADIDEMAAQEAEQLYQRHLLRRAQAGDYEAFERLYALLEPGIGRFVRRLVGHGPESEDIVQDTFLALYTHLDNVVPAARLRPYVYRIARNHCYDRLRLWGRYEEVSIDASEGDGETGSGKRGATFHAPLHLQDEFTTAPDEAAHWLLLSMEVRSAIDRLPHQQRQTLILYCEEELTYAEIAEVMEVSIGTVKSRLFHAKKTLRGLVRPEVLLAIQQDDQEYGGSPTPMGDSASENTYSENSRTETQPAAEQPPTETLSTSEGWDNHGRTDHAKTHPVRSGTSRSAQVA